MGRAEAMGLLLAVVCAAAVIIAARLIRASTRASIRASTRASTRAAKWDVTRRMARPGESIGAIAVGAAVAVAFVGMFSMPAIPPNSRWQWLVWLALLGGVLIAASHVSHRRIVTAVAAVVWIVAVCGTLTLPWLPAALWSAAAVGAGGAVLVWSMTGRQRSGAMAWLTAGAMVWLVGMAGVLIGTGQARFTQVTIAIALAWVASMVASMLYRKSGAGHEAGHEVGHGAGHEAGHEGGQITPSSIVRGGGQAAVLIGSLVWFAGWGYQDSSAEQWLEYTLLLAGLVALGAGFAVSPGSLITGSPITGSLMNAPRVRRFAPVACGGMSAALAIAAAGHVHRDALLPGEDDHDPTDPVEDPADLYSWQATGQATTGADPRDAAAISTTSPRPPADRSAGRS